MTETMRYMNGVNYPRAFGFDFVGNKAFYLPKSSLINGEYYFGTCRNASCAKWIASENCFKYQRYKFGSYFIDTINHPEDDKGFDLFIPIFVCYPEDSEVVE